MEFEMDIPAAEELEWLESNSLLPEFEEEEEEECIVVEDEEVAGSKQSDVSKFQDPAPSHENEIQRKRVRPEEEEGDGASRKTISNEEERGNKRRELHDEEVDDYFLLKVSVLTGLLCSSVDAI